MRCRGWVGLSGLEGPFQAGDSVNSPLAAISSVSLSPALWLLLCRESWTCEKRNWVPLAVPAASWQIFWAEYKPTEGNGKVSGSLSFSHVHTLLLTNVLRSDCGDFTTQLIVSKLGLDLLS